MPLRPGQKLAAYEVIGPLGVGGMGEVYRAKDTRLGRDVALKVLPPEMIAEAGRLERFDREARAIAALNHPNIVTIYSTEEADGIRFLTMELVEGYTLTDLIVSNGMPVVKFLDIAIPLADALAAAHQKQIMHRDLKPGNVMLSNDGRVKVLDFGLARVGGDAGSDAGVTETIAPITHHGVIVGTMPYMSPEQVEGRTLDARSDLFSLGVMFYELLSGERPFKGSSSPGLMSAILRDTPPALAQKRTDIPDALDRLVSRLVEKRPEDRVQTARDVFNELRHIRKLGESGPMRSPSTESAVAAPENLWVAVLPFNVRGGDADAEAMAAALTDDIATGLAKFPGLSVVASQSTRAFKDSPLDVRQIADRLRARYMIGGHVRKSGGTIRTTAQVIDAASGEQLWTETYDRRLDTSDLFAIQDDVTDHIVATLGDKYGVLAKSMIKSLDRTTIAQATPIQLLMYSWRFQHRPLPELHAELRAALESQLGRDPNDAHLWAELANMYIVEHSLNFNAQPDPVTRALAAARRAIELDRSNQTGWMWLAIAHFHEHDRPAFDEACERTLKINPRNSYAMAWMGNMLTHIGEYERGCALTERAMQINPGHPGWLHFAVFNRHFADGDYERALQAARRVNMREFFWMHFAIAAACGQLGMSAEGQKAAKEMTWLAPALRNGANLRTFVTTWYWQDAMIAALVEGAERSLGERSDAPSTSQRSMPSSSSTTPGTQSIAVLPFADLSEKKDQDWFCDGIAEEILSALSPLPGLRVAARASSFSFKGKSDGLRSIADKLNVTTVLEGSVRRAGDRVRITAQLSDAREGRQLWSERFDRELKDIFDVQDEIARAIVERLRVSLSGGERLVQQRTTNIQAYELLLKGRTFLYKRGRAVLDAIPLFERAIELDPTLAEGHALLADAHRLLGLYGLVPSAESLANAHPSIARALELDPHQSEALATLANIRYAFEWNYRASRELTDRVLSIDPTHVRALAENVAMTATALAEPPPPYLVDECRARLNRARALDPLSAWVMAMSGMFHVMVHDHDAALEATAKAIETDPGNYTGHWMRVVALAAAGRSADAQAAAQAAFAIFNRQPLLLVECAALAAARGDRAEAEAIYSELQLAARTHYVNPAHFAAVAASAGRMGEARRWLAQTLAERDPFLVFYKFPSWRPLRADAECAAMLREAAFVKNALT